MLSSYKGLIGLGAKMKGYVHHGGMRQKLLQSRAITTSDPNLHRISSEITKLGFSRECNYEHYAASDHRIL